MNQSKQWFLCEISESSSHQSEDLKQSHNLAVTYPDKFGGWSVWLPIIPRVGDTLQFRGWQVEVSKVVLKTEWENQTGEMEGTSPCARISIRKNILPKSMDAQFSASIDGNWGQNRQVKWEDFAYRGHDLEYYAWELRHPSFVSERKEGNVEYYHWHSRIRPVAGDVISIQDKRWKVTIVELASANEFVDG